MHHLKYQKRFANYLLGAAIFENNTETRSQDSTLFREISREISRLALAERPLSERFREKCEISRRPNAAFVIIGTYGTYLGYRS